MVAQVCVNETLLEDVNAYQKIATRMLTNSNSFRLLYACLVIKIEI